MTEDFRYDREFLTVLEQQRRASVAQVVEPLTWQAGILEGPVGMP